MTIKEILTYSVNKLKEKEIPEPILKSKMLIANTLGKGKEYLLIHENEKIELETLNRIKKQIEELAKGMPIQYIIGKQEFMGLDFFVNSDVLIPQPDTEILAQEVIEISKKYEESKILDLCTGSGAIAVSLKKYISNAKIIASDISIKALEVAKTNAENNNTKIDFICSDLFENIKEQFDIIATNPPYIKRDVIKTLDKEVKNEPILALDGGQDGLDFYKKIIAEAYKHLAENGYLCMEIGYDQKDEVINLIESSKKYEQIYSKKDLAGNDRIIICKRR